MEKRDPKNEGHPIRRAHRHTACLAWMLTLVAAACSQPQQSTDANSDLANAAPQIARSSPPTDEAAFLSAKLRYDALQDPFGKNPIEEQRTWRAANALFCQALSRVSAIHSWIGDINIMNSEGGVQFDLGNGEYMIGKVEPGSALFEKVAGMRDGSRVRFSGTLDRDQYCTAYDIDPSSSFSASGGMYGWIISVSDIDVA